MAYAGQHDLFSEIERFRREIGDFAPGASCRIRYDSNSNGLQAFLAVSEHDLMAARETAESFRHVISHAFTHEKMPRNVVRDQLRSFQFPRYRELLADQLRGISNAGNHEAKEIFCLNVHLYLGNNYAFIASSSTQWRNSLVKQKIAGLKNPNPLDWIYYSFVAYEDRVEVSEDIGAILVGHRMTIESSYARYGEPYLMEMERAYAYCMIDATPQAINAGHSHLAAMNTSEDFIATILLGDEDPYLQELAWRRTLNREAIELQFGPSLLVPI